MKKTWTFLSLMLIVALTLTMFSGCGISQKKVEYIVLDEALADEQYGIAFRKADQTLRDEVQKILCEMKTDGKLAEITKTWFGEDTSTVPDSFKPTQSSDTSLADIKAKGQLILGLDDSFPPMGYQKEDGTIVGYDIDLAREVCKRLGVELKLQPIEWKTKEQELNQGNIDCIWNGLTITPSRSAEMNITEPYMQNRQVVVTLKDSGITKLSDLEDKVAILQQGSTAVDALEAKADIKSKLKSADEVGDNVLAMLELQNGTGDVVIMDEIVARYYIAHMSELEEKGESAAE